MQVRQGDASASWAFKAEGILNGVDGAHSRVSYIVDYELTHCDFATCTRDFAPDTTIAHQPDEQGTKKS